MDEEVLDRDSATPLYIQLEEILRGKILRGEWLPGHRVPSENELNRTYGLSRMTARGVLTRLVNDGLVFRVPGKGTYVEKAKINTISPAYRGVREQLEEMGYQTTTRMLFAGLEVPSANMRRRLALADDEQVYAIHRVRSTDEGPISLHHSFVPARLAPGLDTLDVEHEQLCKVLEGRFGLAMRHVEEHLEIVVPRGQDARHLGLSGHEPCLRLEDLISDGTRTPFEFSRIFFRGDRVRLNFSYEL